MGWPRSKRQPKKPIKLGQGRQAVWANIWCAVLAGKWPSRLRGFRGRGRPVPEVLLSRLPRRKSDYTLLSRFLAVF